MSMVVLAGLGMWLDPESVPARVAISEFNSVLRFTFKKWKNLKYNTYFQIKLLLLLKLLYILLKIIKKICCLV